MVSAPQALPSVVPTHVSHPISPPVLTLPQPPPCCVPRTACLHLPLPGMLSHIFSWVLPSGRSVYFIFYLFIFFQFTLNSTLDTGLPWAPNSKYSEVSSHSWLWCLILTYPLTPMQENSRRTSTSASLTALKLLTVDHNKLWKILKEMGITDHFTCFLRNLYAGQEATVRTGCGTIDWLQIVKGVRQDCILLLCLFNLHAEYIMWNAGLDEAQAGIKIARTNVNNLRYADDTTVMAESKEELKSVLMRVKKESEKAGLKLSIQKWRSWYLVPPLHGR